MARTSRRREAAAHLADALLAADAQGVQPLELPVRGPAVAIVSSAELGEQNTFSADYFVNREPGESWSQFRVRRQAEAAEDRAVSHEGHALHLRAEAAAMRLGAGLPPAPDGGEYERGRADTLAELAGMDPAERALLLSRARHPSGGAPEGAHP